LTVEILTSKNFSAYQIKLSIKKFFTDKLKGLLQIEKF